MPEGKIVWITWESQRRNVSMSSVIHATLYEIIYDDSPGVVRYGLSLIKTLRILVKEQPDVLVVQNPSFVLSFFVTLIKKIGLFKFKLIVDAHNASILPLLHEKGFFKKFMVMVRKFILSNTDSTIVTNTNLADIVLKYGGFPVIIEDPLPAFSKDIKKVDLDGVSNLLFICTYASDEPYLQLIDAVRQVDKEICVYMSGSPNSEVLEISDQLPGNLILTGYLSKDEYDAMLLSVDAVIDLTTREDCLVCGAYEAIAAAKPLVLSDKKALREYFGESGIVYAKNNADDVARSIIDIVDNLENYKQDVQRLKVRLQAGWQKRKNELLLMLNN